MGGVVSTGIWMKNPRITGRTYLLPVVEFIKEQFMWTGEQGALTQLYLGVAVDDLINKDIRGRYYHPMATHVQPSDMGQDEALQKAVFEFTESLIGPDGAGYIQPHPGKLLFSSA